MYRQLNRMMVLGLTGVVAVLTIVAAGCNDDPPNGPEQPREYAAWMYDRAEEHLLRIWPISQRIDTIPIPWVLNWGVKPSPDGTILYLSTPSNIVVVDTAMNVLRELDYVGEVAVAPDGKMIAVARPGITLLSTDDYSVIWDTIIPEYCNDPSFSPDSKRLYCTHTWIPSDSLTTAIVFDLSTVPGTATEHKIGGVNTSRLRSSSTENEIIATIGYQLTYSAIVIYDRADDSLVFEDVSEHVNFITVNSDATVAIYDKSVGFISPPPQDPSFVVFDLITRDTIFEFKTKDTDTTSYPFFPGPLALGPDDRYLFAEEGLSYRLGIFDLQERRYVTHFYTGDATWLAVQSKLTF